MPLVRVEVRNEYGLGLHELYGDANREDPKAVLDGVAVAGLVGILRQLGDLAEFAAEVFHGLQEQVTTTASRSHKLLVRVQQIEAALPLLEKSILAQRSHIHFAYTAGSNWHASIPNEQNHFIYHDLPRFIMDSYEECRDPPRLHLLDKFDTGGLGSCLKRYSDPTFFRRASVGSDEANAEKAQRDKARKIKKKRSLQRNGELSRSASISNRSGRVQYTSANVRGQTSPSRTVSTVDMALKSDLGDHSNSFDSRTGSGYIECVFHLSSPIQPEEQQPKGSSSGLKMQSHDTFDSASPDGQTKLLENGFPHNSPQKQTGCSSSCVTWDEKTEIVEPKGQESDGDEASEMLPTIWNQIDEIESETDNYMDALNTIDSESENDFDCQTKREVEQYSSHFNNEGTEDRDNKTLGSEHHPSDLESCTASHSSSNQGMSLNSPNSVPSVESVISNLSSSTSPISNSQGPTDDKVRSSFCESQESSADVSSVHSVKFWTNGGLLGLEPSKPPDFSVSAFEETSGHQSVSYQTYPETDFKKQFGHMFPSFQLVPDPATPLHDIDFDSDDDTFCRSSPCMSDDCLSHHSESNSEQWECGETLINKDHELYDALCRISSTESVSSSQELEGVAHGTIRADSGHIANGVEPSQSGLLLDLPSFDAVNPLLKQEIKDDSDPRVLLEVQYPKESMPPPPPLPPLQWRALKPDSDMAEEKQYVISEALDHLFDLKLLESTDSQHSEPVLARQQQNVEANACKPKSNVIEKQDRQKSNGQKEVNEAANGKKMDEREDFLEQIRTKSFSLRRTATPRLTVMPTPATNVSVTAILEKANAIRQAVGSDDGEDDDNWSDT
ncbi:unnamed protein product, partial [Vitis vinifera]